MNWKYSETFDQDICTSGKDTSSINYDYQISAMHLDIRQSKRQKS